MTWWHRHDPLLDRGDDGLLYLTCACGHRVPLIYRSRDERARVLSGRDAQSPSSEKRASARVGSSTES